MALDADTLERHQNLRQSPCSKCKKPAFHICYVGDRLVCVSCFTVFAADADTRKESSDGT